VEKKFIFIFFLDIFFFHFQIFKLYFYIMIHIIIIPFTFFSLTLSLKSFMQIFKVYGLGLRFASKTFNLKDFFFCIYKIVNTQ